MHLSTFLTVLFLFILRICLVVFYFCFIYCLKHICNNFYLKSSACPLEWHRTPTIRKVSYYFFESGKFSAYIISLPSVEIWAEMVTIDEFLNLNSISTFCIFSCIFHCLHSLNVRMLLVFRLRCEPQILFDLTLKRQFKNVAVEDLWFPISIWTAGKMWQHSGVCLNKSVWNQSKILLHWHLVYTIHVLLDMGWDFEQYPKKFGHLLHKSALGSLTLEKEVRSSNI